MGKSKRYNFVDNEGNKYLIGSHITKVVDGEVRYFDYNGNILRGSNGDPLKKDLDIQKSAVFTDTKKRI